MCILRRALEMLEKHPLCDHCLGRQFALLGHGLENDERGKALKLALLLKTHATFESEEKHFVKTLEVLAVNGFSRPAKELLERNKKDFSFRNNPNVCFLCEGKFSNIPSLASKALKLMLDYEHNNFLVGIKIPLEMEELEDEFRAEFKVTHGENLRNEFGRLVGKRITEGEGKPAEFMNPDIVVMANPFTEKVRLQVNPLFVAGRYRKLARGIPQSKWFCPCCRGTGCAKCNWTGKLYAESVEEIVGRPFLLATGGLRSSFHASGREDIDARMLGSGRPFVIEITQPKRRCLDLQKIRKEVNTLGKDKVQISALRFASKNIVRKLKVGELAQKKYRVLVEFDDRITAVDLRTLKERLANATVRQRTPIRVLHRRADLIREKYIYDVSVRKMAPRKAEMTIRCQGGLYVKELVHGDEGRTTPSVSEILGNRAKPLKLDVLEVCLK